MPSRCRKARGVELAQRGGEVAPRPLGQLLQVAFVPGVKGDGQGGVEEPLPSPLHLVPQAGHVLQGDLRLRGHGAAPLERQGLGRLEADLLPLQGAGRLLSGNRPQVDGQVHRRSRRHEALEEAGGQGPGPLAQVQRPDQPVSDAHLAPSQLHLGGGVLAGLDGGSAQGRGGQQHPKLAASQRVDGQPGPRQQAPQLVDARELGHGVEAPVEDAVAGLQVGEQPSQGLGRRFGLRGQLVRLRLPQRVPQPVQARRVLADEELHGEVQGVERPGEGPQLRLVDFEAHHLANAQLHPVQAHRPVVVQMGQHEEQGQLGRRLGGRGRRLFRWFGCRHRAGPRNVLRSGGPVGRPLRSSSLDSFDQVLQLSLLLRSRGLGTPRGRS